MTTNLKKINSFILNGYIDTVNKFIGEKIVNEVDEQTASSLDKDTFRFFERLAHKILAINNCERACIFRKGVKTR